VERDDMTAAVRRNEDLFRLLLKAGADVNARTRRAMTALKGAYLVGNTPS